MRVTFFQDAHKMGLNVEVDIVNSKDDLTQLILEKLFLDYLGMCYYWVSRGKANVAMRSPLVTSVFSRIVQPTVKNGPWRLRIPFQRKILVSHVVLGSSCRTQR